MVVQRRLLSAPALNLWSCGWSMTRGTRGVGVCAAHNIFRVSSSTSFYLRLPPLQSRVRTQSLCRRIAVGPLAFAVFMPAGDLHLLGGASAAWEAGEPKGQPGPARDGACCSFPGSRFVSSSSPEKPAGVNFSLLFPPRASAHRELQFADLPAS